MHTLTNIGIIGLGRFGRLMADLLSRQFTVHGYDCNGEGEPNTALAAPLIIFAIPMRQFADSIRELAPKLSDKTVMDVCSVKCYPVDIMQQYLPKSCGIIASHPLFGPDSFDENNALKIMLHSQHDPHNILPQLTEFFIKQKIEIVNITPEEHDRQAAYSQSITHFIGRALAASNIKPTPDISTLGFNKLIDIMTQTCHDSWELFIDMQRYNPYAQEAIDRLLSGIRKVVAELNLPQ